VGRPTTGPAARIGLAVLALVVAGWLAVGLRAAIPETRGLAIARGDVSSPERQREVRDLLTDARSLNPDSQPRVAEASFLVATKKPRQAARLLEPVVRDEPDNAEAWAILAGATAKTDRRRNAQALAQLRRLKPPVRR
jgi:predicted Zn-dependent protease